MRGFGRAMGSFGASLGGAFAFGSFVREGLEFNKTVKDSTVAIGKLVKQFSDLSDAQSKVAGSAAIDRLIELEPKTAGDLGTLIEAFQTALGPAAALGMTLEQALDITSRFANAVANLDLPMDQLRQEIRGALTGDITRDTSVALIQQMTAAGIEEAREAGRAYEYFAEKIGELGVAGDTAQVAFSSLNSAVKQAAGAFTAGLFDESVESSKELTEAIKANGDTFAWLGEKVADVGAATVRVVKEIKGMLDFVGMVGGGLGGLLTGDGFFEGAENERLDQERRRKQRAAARGEGADEEALKTKLSPGGETAGGAGAVDPVEEQRKWDAMIEGLREEQSRAIAEVMRDVVKDLGEELGLLERPETGLPGTERGRYGDSAFAPVLSAESMRLSQLANQVALARDQLATSNASKGHLAAIREALTGVGLSPGQVAVYAP